MNLSGAAHGNLLTKRLKEEVKFAVQVLLRNSKIPLKEEEELLLHGVDFLAVEAELIVLGGHVSVVCPVLVLGRAVIEILGGQDERGEEDAMSSASDAASLGLQTRLEAVEVDQTRHESRDLDIRGDDQLGDEVLNRRELLVVGQALLGFGGLGRRGG